MSGKYRFVMALMAGAALGCLPAAAQAQQQEKLAFDLPAQDLGDALRSVAARGAIELYASADDLEGLKAPRLEGSLTTREAIEALGVKVYSLFTREDFSR